MTTPNFVSHGWNSNYGESWTMQCECCTKNEWCAFLSGLMLGGVHRSHFASFGVTSEVRHVETHTLEPDGTWTVTVHPETYESLHIPDECPQREPMDGAE